MSAAVDLQTETPSSFDDSKNIYDLFDSVTFNKIANLDDISDDEEDYGDEETILSMTTSNRSLLPSQEFLPIIPLLPTNPLPLNEKYWCEPDAATFRVRSASYMKNRAKTNSKPSLFRLFAVDLVQNKGKPILSGLCSHPEERIQKCLLAEKNGVPGSEMPPFIFCVNIVVPGKPSFHIAFYYAIDDKSAIIDPQSCPNDGASDCTEPAANSTPPNPGFQKLASMFFFGDSDKFRDKTFKLIPRIAKGNFVVKSAVGSKPALLGTKVKQHYIRNDRFFEIVVDVGSDGIAKKVVGLSRGYAESLVVDMAFVLEGKTNDTLPEHIMGTVRLSNLDFKAKYRVLDDPKC